MSVWTRSPLHPTPPKFLLCFQYLTHYLQSHQGFAQAEESPGPAGLKGKGHLGIGQGPHWLTHPLMAIRAISK